MNEIIRTGAHALTLCAIGSALVCVAAAGCRLRKMQPGRSTKWVWMAVYAVVFVLAWVALASNIMGTATPFEQACVVTAAAYLWLTIPSWRTVPAVCRINYGRRSTDWPAES